LYNSGINMNQFSQKKRKMSYLKFRLRGSVKVTRCWIFYRFINYWSCLCDD